jgi:DNA-binding response OmpR family regulator
MTTATYTQLMARVLVVDDDPAVRDVLARYLQRDGHVVVQASDGDRAMDVLTQTPVDLAVLDVMIPGRNGLEICRWLRANGDTAVILVTARAEETDRIVGLEIGADDYVTKPFSPREVAARVATVLRRTVGSQVSSSPLVVGDLRLDPATRETTVRGTPVVLTAREFDLMHLLARHPRHVFSREQILETVWGYPPRTGGSATATITVHVRRLREKLELDPSRPRMLQTVHGVGYRLVP